MKEEKYESIAEMAPVGIFEVKFNPLRIVWANREICRILGYTKEELLRMNLLYFTDEAGKRLFLDRVKTQLAGETFDPSAECKIITKDTREILAVLRSALTYTNDVVEGAWVVAQDITERKKAEEALIQTRNRLSVATKAAKIGIHDYDIVANTVQWDERIREIWGVDPDEPITYETFIENVHPDGTAQPFKQR